MSAYCPVCHEPLFPAADGMHDDCRPVSRAEFDALRADVRALARVLMMNRADAPFSESERDDACDRVRRIAERTP